jgi:hypothetical protein
VGDEAHAERGWEMDGICSRFCTTEQVLTEQWLHISLYAVNVGGRRIEGKWEMGLMQREGGKWMEFAQDSAQLLTTNRVLRNE